LATAHVRVTLIATLKFLSGDHQEEVTDQAFGPFSVDPGQISELGVGFADFVNELLRVEVAAAGLDGGQLTTTRLVNVGDGVLMPAFIGPWRQGIFPQGTARGSSRPGI
jgi:hypothetical protein